MNGEKHFNIKKARYLREQGLSYGDIAKQMGFAKSWVHERLNRPEPDDNNEWPEGAGNITHVPVSGINESDGDSDPLPSPRPVKYRSEKERKQLVSKIWQESLNEAEEAERHLAKAHELLQSKLTSGYKDLFYDILCYLREITQSNFREKFVLKEDTE